MYDEKVSLAAKLTTVMKNKYYKTALMASNPITRYPAHFFPVITSPAKKTNNR
jgi:hypothetical protein